MLEIIGWLGSFYLLVKGLEILGNQNSRVPDNEGGTKLSTPALTAAALAIIGAIIFPFVLRGQASGFSGSVSGASSPPSTELTQQQVDCINSAGNNTDKILSCTR